MSFQLNIDGSIDKRKNRGVTMSMNLWSNAAKEAVRKAGIAKRATYHTFLSFAIHLLEDGYGIRSVQELLEHKNVKTTMICTHVLNHDVKGVQSPADTLLD